VEAYSNPRKDATTAAAAVSSIDAKGGGLTINGDGANLPPKAAPKAEKWPAEFVEEHDDHGNPRRKWRFETEDGGDWVQSVRTDMPNGDKPMRRYPVGKKGPWKPLYPSRIDFGAPIVICEGEKTCDALWQAGVQATCWLGGSSSKGAAKRVAAWLAKGGMTQFALWADNDDVGLAAMRAFQAALPAGCQSVIFQTGEEKGADAADLPAKERALVASERIQEVLRTAPARVKHGKAAGITQRPTAPVDGSQFEKDTLYDTIEEMVADFNGRYCCYTGHESRVVDEGVTEHTPDLWPNMMSYTAFEQMLAHVKVKVEVENKDGELETQYWKAAPQWLKHKDRRRRKGTIELVGPHERPRNPYAYTIVVSPPGAELAEFAEGEADVLVDYLLNIVCAGNERNYNWLCDWLADIVQRPWAVGGGCAVVLTGFVGSGKSMLKEHIMDPVLGPKLSVVINDAKEALTGFNHELLGVPLCFADEAIFSGDRGLHQKLKQWTMAQRYPYRRKFQDPIETRNVNRLLAATNDEVAVALEDGDRRFFVLKTPLRFTDAQIDAGEHVKLFKPYVDWFAANAGVMRRFFLNREYDLDTLRSPPLTEAKRAALLGSNAVLAQLAELATIAIIEGDRDGLGHVASRWLKRRIDDRHMSERAIVTQIRNLIGDDNAPSARAYYPMQTAKTREGWQTTLTRGKGVILPTPRKLAELINPKLPQSERITETYDEWQKWSPDASTTGAMPF